MCVCVCVDWGRKRKRQPKRSSNYIVPLKCRFIHILTECESECETFASFPHRLLPERERAHKFVPINVLSLVPGCIWVFWVVIQSGIPRASVDLLHRYQFAIIFFLILYIQWMEGISTMHQQHKRAHFCSKNCCTFYLMWVVLFFPFRSSFHWNKMKMCWWGCMTPNECCAIQLWLRVQNERHLEVADASIAICFIYFVYDINSEVKKKEMKEKNHESYVIWRSLCSFHWISVVYLQYDCSHSCSFWMLGAFLRRCCRRNFVSFLSVFRTEHIAISFIRLFGFLFFSTPSRFYVIRNGLSWTRFHQTKGRDEESKRIFESTRSKWRYQASTP